MQKVEICANCTSPDQCIATWEALFERHNLKVTTRSTLKQLPTSIHLHLRSTAETVGTLEFTLVPATGEVFLSYHENRAKPWVIEAFQQLAAYKCAQERQPVNSTK